MVEPVLLFSANTETGGFILTPAQCRVVTPVVGLWRANQGRLVTPGPDAQRVVKVRLVTAAALFHPNCDRGARPSFVMAARARL